MRHLFLLTVGSALCAGNSWGAGPTPDAGELGRRYNETIKPLVASYCLGCHGKDKPQADFDLSAYPDADSVEKDLARWDMVLEQLEAKTMPPAKAKKKPTEAERLTLVAWIKDVRKADAIKHAGDPGPVPSRRLSNAEYDNTIRDLTGVDIKPTKTFPVDPANKAGFDNSAESLTISPALVKKYLEAARLVADHLILKPDGLAFAEHPVVADTDRDKFCVRRVISFYQKQRTDYADFFLAAWTFENREALKRPDATIDRIAKEAGISPNYLRLVHETLTKPSGEVGPIAALQGMWKALPKPGQGDPAAGCRSMRDFVVQLRRLLVPDVKNLTVPGMNNGSQPLVLWKNREFVANRRRYVGNVSKIKPAELTEGTPEARKLALPADAKDAGRYEESLKTFCSVFPDTFVVTERARVYLDPKNNKGNEGRLLSAGFHSMTGYFRDDAPLYDMILDDAGRRELDRLWLEFDVITGAPGRQYASFLWFDRTDSTFMRDDYFDFARAEDLNAREEGMIQRLAKVYRGKVERSGGSKTALDAVDKFFVDINTAIRRVEKAKAAAEPIQLDALVAFAERAFRRPLPQVDRDGIKNFYRRARTEESLGHEDALRDTLVSVLMSPHFIYRVDQASAGGGVVALDDFDLASRLSYFLWAGMPDEQLLDLARKGELRRPEVLAAQAERMLKDPRARGLATEFFTNLLDIRRFEEHNSVDRNRFPSFDDELRRSMFEEPIRYFMDVMAENRPIRELIEGRHTFVNEPLAKHYGIPFKGKNPDDWVKVENVDAQGRGGLLPMAVFLTKNSPGLRTSPVKRGYWVVRRLLGEHIPAPPNNVPDLPNDEAKLGNLTLREMLEKHRADVNCSGCHQRFDPIGLAFEAYGPIGERRAKDLGGRPVDTKAAFPGGSEGNGLDGLRVYLKEVRMKEFSDNFRRKLLSYALGRSLQTSDDEIIEAMESKSGGELRFRSLVEAIVVSPQFRNKRVESGQAEE